MPLRLTVGSVSVEVEHQEAADAYLRSLLRLLNNLEVADLLGVTDKTVRRWKRSGRLPSRSGGQVMLLDLLAHLHTVPGSATAGLPPRSGAWSGEWR